MSSKQLPIPIERIEKAIRVVRGEKVMLDSTLAELYGVETKQLKRAVGGISVGFLLTSCLS